MTGPRGRTTPDTVRLLGRPHRRDDNHGIPWSRPGPDQRKLFRSQYKVKKHKLSRASRRCARELCATSGRNFPRKVFSRNAGNYEETMAKIRKFRGTGSLPRIRARRREDAFRLCAPSLRSRGRERPNSGAIFVPPRERVLPLGCETRCSSDGCLKNGHDAKGFSCYKSEPYVSRAGSSLFEATATGRYRKNIHNGVLAQRPEARRTANSQCGRSVDHFRGQRRDTLSYLDVKPGQECHKSGKKYAPLHTNGDSSGLEENNSNHSMDLSEDRSRKMVRGSGLEKTKSGIEKTAGRFEPSSTEGEVQFVFDTQRSASTPCSVGRDSVGYSMLNSTCIGKLPSRLPGILHGSESGERFRGIETTRCTGTSVYGISHERTRNVYPERYLDSTPYEDTNRNRFAPLGERESDPGCRERAIVKEDSLRYDGLRNPALGIQKKKKKKIQIIPDCSGWSLASQTLHRQIWKFRGRRPLPVSACPRRHQRAVANTLRRRTVRQHGLPKRCKPGKGAGSLRGGSGTVLRVLGLVGYQPSLLE